MAAQLNPVPPQQGSDGQAVDAKQLGQLLDRRLLLISIDQLCDFCHAQAVLALTPVTPVTLWPFRWPGRSGRTQHQTEPFSLRFGVRIEAHKLHVFFA